MILKAQITDQANEMIQQMGRTHEDLMMMVMGICLVVTIFALGLDFWRNWFYMIFFPRVTFTRIAGEQQVLPAIFVVLFFSFISTMIAIYYWSIPIVKAGYLEMIEEQLRSILQSIPAIPGADFESLISDTMQTLQRDISSNLALLAVIPLNMLFSWFYWGLAYFITGKVLAKGGAQGLVNYLSGVAYFFWVYPLITLGHWMGYIEHLYTFGTVLMILFAVILLVYLIFTMRDYMHCSWINAIIGVVILAPVLYVVLSIAGSILLVIIYTYIEQYI